MKPRKLITVIEHVSLDELEWLNGEKGRVRIQAALMGVAGRSAVKQVVTFVAQPVEALKAKKDKKKRKK